MPLSTSYGETWFNPANGQPLFQIYDGGGIAIGGVPAFTGAGVPLFSMPSVLIQGLPAVTVGPVGSNYPITSYGNSFGAALNAAIVAAGTGNVPNFAIQIGPGNWTIDVPIDLSKGSPGLVVEGCGESATILYPAASLGVDAISTYAKITPNYMRIGKMSFNGNNVIAAVAAATSVTVSGSPWTYTHGTTGTTPATTPGYVVVGVSGVTFTPGSTNCAITQVGGTAKSIGSTSAKVAALLSTGSGLWMNLGDTLLLTWSVGTPTLTYQQNNGYLNLTSTAYVTGVESGTNAQVYEIRFLNSQYVGSSGYNALIFDGNEDSVIRDVRGNISATNPNSGIQCQTYNGFIRFVNCKADGWTLGGLQVDFLSCEIGETGLVWTNACQQSGTLNIFGGFCNGVSGSAPTFTLNNAAKLGFQMVGMNVIGGTAGVSATTFFAGAVGIPNTTFYFVNPRLVQGSLANNPNIFSAIPASVQGNIYLDTNSNFTNANAVVNIPATSAFAINRWGVITGYVGTVPLSGVNTGSPSVPKTSIQNAVTNSAITSVTYTTPSTAGIYEISGYVEVTTGTTIALKLKLTYGSPGGTDPVTDGIVFTNSGSVTLLLSLVAAGRYYFSHHFHTDASGTAITIADNAGTYTTCVYNFSCALRQIA